MKLACPHHAARVPAAAEVRGLIARAEARIAEAGEALTPPRRRTLELLAGAGQPIKAYDLIARYDARGVTKPPTVYRALDFLMRHGLVHRVESQNAYGVCQHLGHGSTVSWLLCECCGAAQELTGPAPDFADVARASGFKIRSAVAEFTGLCGACRSEATTPTA